MRNQTVNGIDVSGRYIVRETDNTISIRCDPTHVSYILTTAPTLIAKHSILYVQGHGEYYCYAGSNTRRANMQSYLIMLTLSGNELLEYQNCRYEMGPGTFCWIDCMHLHYFLTLEKEQPRHAMWLHFYGQTAEFYYRQFLRTNNNSVVCRLPDDNIIVDDIKQLIRLYHNNSESLEVDITASALATSIATACIKATNAQQENSPIPKVVKSVKSYIGLNYQEPITLDSLAAQFAVNKYHLQKQFKRYIGLSPGEFLAHTRMTRAKELLRSTDNTISDIAEEVGIVSASNFTYLFKKHENTTPMSYRKNWIDPRMTVGEEEF